MGLGFVYGRRLARPSESEKLLARRAETPREREARDRLKKRHVAEVKACGKFFDIADRRKALEAELDQLEREEADVVAELTAVTDPGAVAEMIGWSISKVRAASKLANGPIVDVAGADAGTPPCPGPSSGPGVRPN
ncbi:hypothetical protein [Ilumatobacter sp.]|uniref:hypothetical protein n=1 Tax=Ilumatobacter sp. TaxID=1967498 RepID=UPI003B5295B6